LQENNLFLKAEKCIFKAWEIEFLGMIISPDGIKMDPIKINAIMSWPILKHIKDSKMSKWFWVLLISTITLFTSL
jgi:hypothetical protein